MTSTFLNKSVTLEGLTRKGKDRVKRDGASGWRVTKVAPSVMFSTQSGPWLFIENGDEKASRWVHGYLDANFKVTVEMSIDLENALQSQLPAAA